MVLAKNMPSDSDGGLSECTAGNRSSRESENASKKLPNLGMVGDLKELPNVTKSCALATQSGTGAAKQSRSSETSLEKRSPPVNFEGGTYI